MVSQSSTGKIRLLCVIGHGSNLLKHYIEHYKSYVDEIFLVVYQSEKSENLLTEVQSIVDEYDGIKIVETVTYREYDWEYVTYLYNNIKNTYPNDWWVVADIDELHLYPDNELRELIKNCENNGWELIRGGFIDRVGRGGEFPIVNDDKSLWEQFPHAGFFRYPMSKACPNKVCVMKGYIEITAGQHYAKIDGNTTWKWQGWNHPLICPHSTVQVHHFKWDFTAIQRIRDVATISKEYAYSNEYRLMYKELAKVKFIVDMDDPEYMFEYNLTEGKYDEYKNWNKLINKIKSI